MFPEKANTANEQNSLTFSRKSGFREAARNGMTNAQEDAIRTRVVNTLFPPFVRLKRNLKENKNGN
jgi:hypothetical protein